MRDLSGHMIKKYDIHAGIAVPNIAINYPLRMRANEYYAIEPFITTGNGISILKNPNSHYMLTKKSNDSNLNFEEMLLYNHIKQQYSTLPFCQRWLYEGGIKVSEIDKLCSKNILNKYPPIYDINGSIISKFEHTIFVKENGIINLTKNTFY